MIFEVGELAETPVAHITLVWPAAVVYIHMTLQVTRGGERLGA